MCLVMEWAGDGGGREKGEVGYGGRGWGVGGEECEAKGGDGGAGGEGGTKGGNGYRYA